jgi:hypothetical protein
MNRERKPTANRVPQADGSSKSLNMSIGKKKLHASKDTARLMYADFVINGVSYCRRHLMIYCHLCKEDKRQLREMADSERKTTGLRMGGDPKLNTRAEKWGELMEDKSFEKTLKADHLRQMYERVPEVHQQHWMGM